MVSVSPKDAPPSKDDELGSETVGAPRSLRVHFHPGLPVPTVESMTDQLECLWPLSLVVTAMVLTQEAVRFSGRLPVAQLPALELPAFPPSDALGAGSAGLHALGAVPPPMLPPTQSALYETTVSCLRMHFQQLEHSITASATWIVGMMQSVAKARIIRKDIFLNGLQEKRNNITKGG